MNQGISQKALACVITCFDKMNLTKVTVHYDNRFGPGNWWLIREPGGIKGLTSPDHPYATDYILWKIEVARKIAPFGIIIFLPHSHCIAYELAGVHFDDPREEEAFHKKEIEKAIEMTRQRFPDVAFESNYFLKDEQRMAWGMH